MLFLPEWGSALVSKWNLTGSLAELMHQIDLDFRTEDMLEKTLVRFFALMLVLMVALITSCTSANQNSNSRAVIPPGSSANPQTGMKKETGGT